MNLVSIAGLLAITFLFQEPALASVVTYHWSFTGPNAGLTGSGTLDVDSTDLITALDGTFGGNAMTLLAPGSFGDNDNLFFVSEPHFDINGLSFSTNIDTYNFYYEFGRYKVGNLSIGGVSGDFSATLATVPEPATLALVGLALSGIAIARGKPRGKH